MLIASRLMHAVGMPMSAPNVFRASGAILTWLAILGLAIEALLLLR
jgi:uncharacterized membrane protein YecN with MAPEG domain